MSGTGLSREANGLIGPDGIFPISKKGLPLLQSLQKVLSSCHAWSLMAFGSRCKDSPACSLRAFAHVTTRQAERVEQKLKERHCKQHACSADGGRDAGAISA